MQLKWGIAQKGLVLISVPLIFQLLFIFVVAFALFDIDCALKKASRSRDVIACADDIGRLFLQLSTVAGAYILSGNSLTKDRYSQLKSETLAQYENIESLVADKPAELREIRSSRKILDSCLRDLDAFQSRARPGSINAILGSLQAKKTSLDSNIIGKSLFRVITMEQQGASEGAKIRKALMFRAQLLLFAGFVITGGITIGLGMYFWRGVTARLKDVVENSKRLAVRVELLPPMKGSDEIAELDKAFHSAVAALNVLEKKKVALTIAIGRRLELPLRDVEDVTHAFLSEQFCSIDEKTRARLDSAASSSRRLLHLLADLRGASARSESGVLTLHFSHLSVSSILDAAIDTVNQIATQRDVDIKCYLDNSIKVEADHDRLIQVIVNLLSNAIKYAPSKTTVSVKAEIQDGWLLLSVLDQGSGIKAEHHDKIFGMFEQVSARDSAEKGGSGLGLLICKNIVQAHGGTISVKSEIGMGATFLVRIPCRQTRDPAQRQNPNGSA